MICPTLNGVVTWQFSDVVGPKAKWGKRGKGEQLHTCYIYK